MELKKSVRLAMFLAISIVLNIVESIIPLFNGIIPGLKLGLANIIVLMVLYIYSFKDALFISITRVFIVGILRTGIFSITFMFSLVGSLFSVCMMGIFKRTKLSMIGISVIGSIFHTIGQLLTATIILKNINVFYYMPIIIIFSIFTGIVIGYLSKEFVHFFEDNNLD